MKFIPTSIPDVVLVEPVVHGDERGFFLETFHAAKFAEAGLDLAFVQHNHSRSRRGTLRGLHYQIRHPQGKLVRAVTGEVFDVAVDLRRSSDTFGRWVGETLSAANKRMLWIPAGFAHGFYVLSEMADFAYACTDLYAPEHERTLRWDDPDVAIDWPLAPGDPPQVSGKDQAGLSLSNAEVYP
jgi:dTDP-4-dehydrorhamnose 3,5-epimerase